MNGTESNDNSHITGLASTQVFEKKEVNIVLTCYAWLRSLLLIAADRCLACGNRFELSSMLAPARIVLRYRLAARSSLAQVRWQRGDEYVRDVSIHVYASEYVTSTRMVWHSFP